jgi:hypothetical protein
VEDVVKEQDIESVAEQGVLQRRWPRIRQSRVMVIVKLTTFGLEL